jgi:hypothetical protein
MSALPPKADIDPQSADVRFAKSGYSALRQLFDHLVGAAEQRQRGAIGINVFRLQYFYL